MHAPLDLARLSPGFADPTQDSQRVFRRIMEATARPGRIESVDPAPVTPPGLERAAGALLLALADADTLVWLDPQIAGTEAETWLRFHCGCPTTPDPGAAAFAYIADPMRMPPLSAFHPGEAKYPDRAATVVIAVKALSGGPLIGLEGPGVRGQASIAPVGLPADFWARRAEVVARFQFGVDLVLCAGGDILSIPRTARTVHTEA